MTTQALYNRWRGQTFEDILGQEHITRTLQNQIKAGRIGHAYLFTGMRGTGKTSTARIFAKAVNCTGGVENPPCNECPTCRHINEGRSLDLIEIDAASNRGIDEIRDLRDRVAFVPQESRFKVYVIDEVHMLTTEAFNALLKTLEEPPAHVIFILCTTEPHRLPDTILSRCQRFDFRRGSVSTIADKLRRICAAEGLSITPEAIQRIARRAGGSFRDAESLLDQLASFSTGEITASLVEAILGTPALSLILDVVRSVATADIPLGLRAINRAIDEGAEPQQFLSEVLEHLRALLLLRVGGEEHLANLEPEAMRALRELASLERLSTSALVRAIRLFNDAGPRVRNAVRPQLPLELALVEALLSVEGGPAEGAEGKGQGAATRQEGIPSRVPAPEPAAPVQEAPPTAAAAPPVPEGVLPSSDAEEAPPPAPDKAVEETPSLTLDWVRGHWDAVILRMRSLDRQVQALLRDAYPVAVQGQVITLGCKWALHRDKLSQEDKRALVEQVLTTTLGVPCRIQCIVQPEALEQKAAAPAGPPNGGLLDLRPPSEDVPDARQSLLNHPVVKDLQRRGGRISRIELYDQEKKGGT